VREASLAAMTSAKELAQYAALSELGYDVAFLPGPAQVGGFGPDLCPEDAPPLRACNVLEVGDTIVAVDGEPVPTVDLLPDLLAQYEPGDVVTLTVVDMGSAGTAPTEDDLTRAREVDVELTAAPDDPERTLVGFTARDTRTVELPFEVDIDTNRIGGPSAGLAFSLALIDELTEGELTGDERVAVTGTIDEAGNVGAIGALPQKADAVRRAGATVFIVPASQSEEDLARAREVAGPGVRIITVSTLAEALTVLEELGGDPVRPVFEPEPS
jgi:PDZ domain-containing protein